VSDDHSRTWLFLVDNVRLRLWHDHRKEDGSLVENKLYGSYAGGNGTSPEQHFPNDDYTIAVFSDDRDGRRVWYWMRSWKV
jgi:hypothetical protein